MMFISAANGEKALVSDEDYEAMSKLKWWTGNKPSSGGGGFRGVYKQPYGDSYQVKISVGGALVQGGNFKDKTTAARKYDEMAIRYYGEFAVLNFPNEVK